MNKEITLVLLTHKSKNLVENFIKKIYGKVKILIIDNSDDHNLKKDIELNYPLIDIYIIENKGYGNAINFGSKFIQTEYFLICNPDIDGISLITLLDFVNAAKKLKNNFSVLGPRFINANPKSHKQSIDNNGISEMKFLSGACMFFNKKNFYNLGGFDENFFLYFEENDFCLRSHKINKNYQINFIKIKHNVGNSVITKNSQEQKKLKNLRTWHFIWSKYYYHKKHYGFLLSIIYFIPIIFRTIFKIFFSKLTNNHENLEKYKIRLNGLINSICGKKSHKRLDEN